MGILTEDSVSPEPTFKDPMELKSSVEKSSLQPKSHGRAVCDGSECGHRKGGCLVQQPANSSSTEDGKTRDSTGLETGRATDRSTLVIGEFEARQDGPETNEPVAVVEKESREDTSTSGYQSLSLDTQELKEKLRVKLAKKPSYDLSPCSAHMDTSQKEKFSHGQLQLCDSLQETLPLKSSFNLQMLQDNFFRERGTTMAHVTQPFKSADPGGGDQDLVVLEEC